MNELANLIDNLKYKELKELSVFIETYLDHEGFEINNGDDEPMRMYLAEALLSWASQNQTKRS